MNDTDWGEWEPPWHLPEGWSITLYRREPSSGVLRPPNKRLYYITPSKETIEETWRRIQDGRRKAYRSLKGAKFALRIADSK